jgi:hypothetical protein
MNNLYVPGKTAVFIQLSSLIGKVALVVVGTENFHSVNVYNTDTIIHYIADIFCSYSYIIPCSTRLRIGKETSRIFISQQCAAKCLAHYECIPKYLNIYVVYIEGCQTFPHLDYVIKFNSS